MNADSTGRIPWIVTALAAAGAAVALVVTAPAAPTGGKESDEARVPAPAGPFAGDACIACHSDGELRVKHPRLFDYFQRWRLSTHAQEGVRCVDCHGGDPTAPDKETAHGDRDGGALGFRHVPETCGRCHGDMYEAYVQSRHHAAMVASDQARAGPTCVTCHGSLDALALTPSTVDAVCGDCHADAPVIGSRAETLLRELDVVNAYGRYVRLRGSPETIGSAARTLEPVHRNLIREWHGFDLDAIEARTRDLIELSRYYRDRVRQERQSNRAAEVDGTTPASPP